MDAFKNTPPITRTLAASVFVVSMLITCQLLDPSRLVFESPLVFKRFPEIWRFFTSFLLARNLEIIFVPYSIWNFGGALERDVPRFSSANFVIYLLFVGSIIVTLDTFLFGGGVFTSILVLAICWSYAQNHRGQIVNFFFINIPVMYLPWAMLFITLVQAGPLVTMREAIGIPAAHLYEFLTYYWPIYGGGYNFLAAPRLLVNYFGEPSNIKGLQPNRQSSSRPVPGSMAAAPFASGSSWGQRGQGRRLGSD